MVALIHNHSFGLKLWRVLGVALMLTQSGCDVKDNRIKKRRLRARREGVSTAERRVVCGGLGGGLCAVGCVRWVGRWVV